MVAVKLWPDARLAIEAMVVLLPVQVPLLVQDTKPMPAGNTSVMTTPVAVPPPLLVTCKL